MKDIRVFLSDVSGNTEMLFLDERMYDGALCGVIENEHNNMVAVYNEDALLEILMDMMETSSYDTVLEYYMCNIYGAYVGENTPKFINLLTNGTM